MATRDEYTAEIDALETLDDFDDAEDELDEDELDPDLETDLDEEDLDEDLGPDLDTDLTVGLEVADDLEVEEDDEEVIAPHTTKLEEDDDEVLEDDDEDEEGEEALDVLLLTREAGLDDDVRLDDEPRAGLSNSDAPIGAGEFTCRSCFLVKRRPQLADPDLMICFDCM
ncbi:MAG: hypothetical protein ACRDZO_15060 [Egibacteraceae bacterium]